MCDVNFATVTLPRRLPAGATGIAGGHVVPSIALARPSIVLAIQET